MRIYSVSPAQTRKTGQLLGRKIFLSKKGPIVLALRGGLGSGKTTFLQGLSCGLEIEEEITSPTFVIFKKYKIAQDRFFYHFDAYRVQGEEIIRLNFREIISGEKNIIAIEWSENIEEVIPEKRIDISFSFINPKERELIIKDKSGTINDYGLGD